MTATELHVLLELVAAALIFATGLLLLETKSAQPPCRVVAWVFLSAGLCDAVHAVLASGLLAAPVVQQFFEPAAWVAGRMITSIGLLVAVIDHEEWTAREKSTHLPRLGIVVSMGAAAVILASVVLGLPPLTLPYGGIPRPVEMPSILLLACALVVAAARRERILLAIPWPMIVGALALATLGQVAMAFSLGPASPLALGACVSKSLSYALLLAGIAASRPAAQGRWIRVGDVGSLTSIVALAVFVLVAGLMNDRDLRGLETSRQRLALAEALLLDPEAIPPSHPGTTPPPISPSVTAELVDRIRAARIALENAELGIADRRIPLRLAEAGVVGLVGLLGILAALHRARARRFAHQAEAALGSLAHAEDRLRLVTQGVKHGILTFDHEGTILMANARVGEILGRSTQDLLGSSIRDVVPHASGRSLAIEELMGQHEFSVAEPGGRCKLVRCEVSALRTGRALLATASFDDITETLERAKSLALYGELIRRSNDAVVVTDAQGTILEVNSSFTRLTGYSVEELIGQNPRLLKSGRQDSEFYTALWRQLTTTGHWSGEIWNRRKDGSLYLARLSISSVSDATGSAYAYLGIQVDMTETRHRLDAERAANAMLRLGLQDEPLDAILAKVAKQVVESPWLGLEGGASGFFLAETTPDTFVLRAGHELPGHVATCCDLFESGACPCHTAEASGDPPGEGAARDLHWARIRGADGPLGVFIVKSPEPRPIGALERDSLSVLTDVAAGIIALKTAQEKVQASLVAIEAKNRDLQLAQQAAAEANRLKSEFLANTSHELRTPLNSILGYLQLVLDGLYESRDEEVEFVSNALESGRHLLALINDVLDIAKIEAGKLVLEHTAVDLKAVFERVQSLCNIQAEMRGVRLSIDDPPRGLRARGDESRLRQVLLNLVGNAIKFTEPEGLVSMKCRLDTEEAQVVIDVVDTGIGIPPDKQELIFESFTQVDATSTRRYGGTGLGLAISRMLVERMGGWIGVQSAEGEGSTFSVSLPVWRDAAAAVAPSRRRAEQRSAPARPALVVEDDPAIATELASLLEACGHSVRYAPDALEALEAIEQFSPELIAVDYGLPLAENSALVTGWDLVAAAIATDREVRPWFTFVTPNAGQLRRRLRYLAVPRAALSGEPALLRETLRSLTGRKKTSRLLVVCSDPAARYHRLVGGDDLLRVEVVTTCHECLLRLRDVPKPFDAVLIDSRDAPCGGRSLLERLRFGRELAGAALACVDDSVQGSLAPTESQVFPVFSRAEVRANPAAFASSVLGKIPVPAS
ncbi:MAG: PAS domain S-box protein [Planctomycetota bacterium]